MKRKGIAHWAVKQGVDDLWHFHLVAGNGRVIMDGAEGYASQSDAKRALHRAADISLIAAEYTRQAGY